MPKMFVGFSSLSESHVNGEKPNTAQNKKDQNISQLTLNSC
jgi:hypothetical protein